MIYTVMYNTSTYWRSHLAAVKKQSGRIRLSAAYIFYTFSNRPAVRSCQILWDVMAGGSWCCLDHIRHLRFATGRRRSRQSLSRPFLALVSPQRPPQRPLNATELPPGGPHERSNGRSDLLLACYDARLSSFINNNPESNRLFRPLSVFVSPWHINLINTRHSTSFYARYYHYHTLLPLWMPRTKQNFVTFQLRITYHRALSSSLCLKVAWLRNNGRIEDAKTSVGVCVNTWYVREALQLRSLWRFLHKGIFHYEASYRTEYVCM